MAVIMTVRSGACMIGNEMAISIYKSGNRYR